MVRTRGSKDEEKMGKKKDETAQVKKDKRKPKQKLENENNKNERRRKNVNDDSEDGNKRKISKKSNKKQTNKLNDEINDENLITIKNKLKILICETFNRAQNLSTFTDSVTKLVKIYDNYCRKDSYGLLFYDIFTHFVKLTFDGEIKCVFTKRVIEFIAKFLQLIVKNRENKQNESPSTSKNQSLDVTRNTNVTLDDFGMETLGYESFATRVTQTPQEELNDNFVDKFFEDLIIPTLYNVLNNVRYNSCLLVRYIFLEIHDIDKDVYSKLRIGLLARIADKNTYVREAAAAALCRFQDLDDQKDLVSLAYRFHMKNDSAFTVRHAVLLAIEPNKYNIDDILVMTRDIKDAVRKAAYNKIVERLSVKKLKIAHRINILKNGLNDRNPAVKKFVETKIIKNWLDAYDNDIIDLITALDVPSESETIEKMCFVLFNQYLNEYIDEKDNQTNSKIMRTKLHLFVENFQKQMLDNKKLLTKVGLTSESSFLWRCLIKFCKENEDKIIKKQTPLKLNNEDDELNEYDDTIVNEIDDMLAGINVGENSMQDDENGKQSENIKKIEKSYEKEEVDLCDRILPQIPHYCNYLKKFQKNIESNDYDIEDLLSFEFMFEQLMEILYFHEIGDEPQRNAFIDVMRNMLISPNFDFKLQNVIKLVMKCLSKHGFINHSDYLVFTSKVIGQLYTTLLDDQQINNENIEVNISSKNKNKDKKAEEQVYNPAAERENELKYAKLTIELEDLRDSLDDAVKRKDYIAAQEIKEKMEIMDEERQKAKNNRVIQKEAMQEPDEEVEGNEDDERRTETLTQQKTQTLDLNNHPEILLKCVQIFCYCLEFGNFKFINDIIQSHFDNIALPGILSDNSLIRFQSVKTLGICCFINEKFVKKYFPLLMQILIHDEQEIKGVALKSIFDLLCQHGFSCLVSAPSSTLPSSEIRKSLDNSSRRVSKDSNEEISEGEKSSEVDDEDDIIKKITQMINDQFDSNSEEIKYITAQGVAKLLILGRLYSPNLLSTLIILWYHPDTDSQTKQFIGLFLESYARTEIKYAVSGQSIALSCQTALEECYIETIERVYRAKMEIYERDRRSSMNITNQINYLSQLASVDVDNMIAFMTELVVEDRHARLAVSICQRIEDLFSSISLSTSLSTTLSSPNSLKRELLMKYLFKALPYLYINQADKQEIKDIIVLMKNITNEFKEKLNNVSPIFVKKLEKFNEKVNTLYKQIVGQENNDLTIETDITLNENSVSAIFGQVINANKEADRDEDEDDQMNDEEIEIDDPDEEDDETITF